MYFCIAPLGAALCCLRPVCELHLSHCSLSTQMELKASAALCLTSRCRTQHTLSHTYTHIPKFLDPETPRLFQLCHFCFLCILYFVAVKLSVFFFSFFTSSNTNIFTVFWFLFKSSCLHCTKYSFWNMFYSYKVFGFF